MTGHLLGSSHGPRMPLSKKHWNWFQTFGTRFDELERRSSTFPICQFQQKWVKNKLNRFSCLHTTNTVKYEIVDNNTYHRIMAPWAHLALYRRRHMFALNQINAQRHTKMVGQNVRQTGCPAQCTILRCIQIVVKLESRKKSIEQLFHTNTWW